MLAVRFFAPCLLLVSPRRSETETTSTNTFPNPSDNISTLYPKIIFSTLHKLHTRNYFEYITSRIQPVCTDPAGRFFSRCLSAWGLYPLPRASSVPTSRDAHSVSHPVAAWVRGACTPFRGRRHHRSRGNPFQPLLECAGPALPSASVVCTDRVGRSLRFTCRCCCLSVWSL